MWLSPLLFEVAQRQLFCICHDYTWSIYKQSHGALSWLNSVNEQQWARGKDDDVMLLKIWKEKREKCEIKVPDYKVFWVTTTRRLNKVKHLKKKISLCQQRPLFNLVWLLRTWMCCSLYKKTWSSSTTLKKQLYLFSRTLFFFQTQVQTWTTYSQIQALTSIQASPHTVHSPSQTQATKLSTVLQKLCLCLE